jgi:hypothetical protein
MAKSSMRIVLVDALGDVMFSGESMIATELPTDEAEERCPETKRSATSESGIFAKAAYDAVETLPENADEIRSSPARPDSAMPPACLSMTSRSAQQQL